MPLRDIYPSEKLPECPFLGKFVAVYDSLGGEEDNAASIAQKLTALCNIGPKRAKRGRE
jgi:hypothetical protein